MGQAQDWTKQTMIHGGDLAKAMQRHGGKKEDWLDLSTGINRRSYPFDVQMALSDIRDLPSQIDLDTCLMAARAAYRCPAGIGIVAAPGTQILINSLPFILASKQCCILEPTYSEHRRAMELAGIACHGVASLEDISLNSLNGGCVIVVNPNNPDGLHHSKDTLIQLAQDMAHRKGFLIIDEAFGDIDPSQSLAPSLGGLPNVIILRSFGKFFGLAGVRLGFALGAQDITNKLALHMGPWAASSSALKIGTQALQDQQWQEAEREILLHWTQRLKACLTQHGLALIGGTSLYQLASHDRAHELHQHLAKHHIWSRIFDFNEKWVRFGIPMSEGELARLDKALGCWCDQDDLCATMQTD